MNSLLSAFRSKMRDRQGFISVIIVGVAFGTGLIRLAELVHGTAVDLLFEDQWDFLTPVFDSRGVWACFFWQHGPHRQGVGGLIQWYLYRAIDWDVRAESWICVGLLTLAALTMINLAARVRGRLHWSDAAFPLLILSPVHWETMLLTPNSAHSIAPLFMVILGAWAWTIKPGLRRAATVSFIGIISLFTGFGIFGAAATLVIGIVFLILQGSEQRQVEVREALLVVGAIGTAFYIFGKGYEWQPAVPGWYFPVQPWWSYMRFVAFMFGSLLGWREMSALSVTIGATAVIFVASAFAFASTSLVRGKLGTADLPVWTMTATALGYAMFVAVGRLPVNMEAAFMWRYSTLLVLGLCALGLWISRVGTACRRPYRFAFIGLWLIIAVLVWGNFTPDRDAAAVAIAKRRWVQSYLESGDLLRANADSNFWVYFPDPASERIKAKLDFLEQHHLSFFRTKEPK